MSADGHLSIVEPDITVRPVAGRIGAEVEGVRPSATWRSNTFTVKPFEPPFSNTR